MEIKSCWPVQPVHKASDFNSASCSQRALNEEVAIDDEISVCVLEVFSHSKH